MAERKNLKGLILCAGLGTRMRPITYTMVKPLIPVANKPVIHYAIEGMKAAGISEIGIIVGETGPEVRAALGTGKAWGMEFTYITQDNPRGLAHAALCAEDYMGGCPFLMYLGDNLIQGGVTELAARFRRGVTSATILLKPVPEPRHFGVAEVGKNNAIISLEEKPKKPRSNLAITGLYCFDSNIFTAAKSIKPSKRGELEITDAISWLLHNGYKVDCHIVTGWWHDTGQKNDMLAASRSILGELSGQSILGKLDAASSIEGPAVIERGARITLSRIIGPVIIGRGATIHRSVIGPFVTIDKNAAVAGSEITDSILLEGCSVAELPGRLERSLIGRGASIGGGAARPRAIVATLGEKSSVEIL